MAVPTTAEVYQTLVDCGATLTVENGRLSVKNLNPIFAQRFGRTIQEHEAPLKVLVERLAKAQGDVEDEKLG